MWKSYFLPSPTIIVPATINYIQLTLALKGERTREESAGVHIYPSGGMCFHRGRRVDEKCFTDEILNISLPGQQLFYGLFSCISKTQKTTDINQTII